MFAQIFMQNPRLVWVRRDLRDHQSHPTANLEQLDQVTPSPIPPDREPSSASSLCDNFGLLSLFVSPGEIPAVCPAVQRC